MKSPRGVNKDYYAEQELAQAVLFLQCTSTHGVKISGLVASVQAENMFQAAHFHG